MTVMHVVGTRPNFMKIAPLLQALQDVPAVSQRLIHTGQHYDAGLSDVFFDQLGLPEPDHFLGVGSGSHAEQTAKVIVAVEELLLRDRPDVVVVPGDVNSSMAAALAAVKLDVPVVHLEAGLRSRDRSMPEEHNRVVVDHVSDLLLTTSRDADENLAREGVDAERIAFVGNTMIDSLRRHEAIARELDVAGELGVSGHLLVTLHRPALVDRRDALLPVMETLEAIAEDRPVLFPVHPRTAARLADWGWTPRRVRLLEPQPYVRFLSLETSAAVVLTDSGGVQEETTVLGVPCLTMRENTERPVTVWQGTNRLIGVGPEALEQLRDLLATGFPPAPSDPPEGWDGGAGRRAAEAIVSRYGTPAGVASVETAAAPEL